jgi:antitoxin VapB
MKRRARAATDEADTVTAGAETTDADAARPGRPEAGIAALPRGPASERRGKSTPAPTDRRKFARVFMSGRSQAVRLPKEFRFDTDRVVIRREGRSVVLTPPFKDWDDYFENSTPLTDDFYEAMREMRPDLPPLEKREPSDRR